MRRTSLPVVGHLASLDDALRTMRRAKRSGIVVRKRGKFRLHTAKEVTSAKEKGSAQKLQDLRGTPIHVAALALTRRSTSRASHSTQLLLNSLKKSGNKYGLLSTPSGKASKADVYSLTDVGFEYLEPKPRPKTR
jgi:chaperonin GroEL (HSP60 family)